MTLDQLMLPIAGLGPARSHAVARTLADNHYLGPCAAGRAYADRFGVAVFSAPTSRMLPPHWLDLRRWCITSDERNAGTQMWRGMLAWVRENFPEATTIVSYSDPTQHHTGGLYRACSWLWAPTWHRVCPPPTGGGSWSDGVTQAPKDRWIFPVRRDPGRVVALAIGDGYARRFPWSAYDDKIGADWWACRGRDLALKIQPHLTPDLLRKAWRDSSAHPHAGHCYVASEAIWHATGRRMRIRRAPCPGGQHWWLETRRGHVVDPTAAQFPGGFDYAAGIGAAFLTREPSKQARVLMERAGI